MFICQSRLSAGPIEAAPYELEKIQGFSRGRCEARRLHSQGFSHLGLPPRGLTQRGSFPQDFAPLRLASLRGFAPYAISPVQSPPRLFK